MSKKKKYLIELFLKSSKCLHSAKENLKVHEDFMKSSHYSVDPSDFKKIMDENGADEFLEEITPIVSSHFSEEEVKSMIDFFSSPVGRKLTNKNYSLEIKKIIDSIFLNREKELSKIEKV